MNRSESFASVDIHAVQCHVSWASLEVRADNVPEMRLLISGSDDDVRDLKITVEEGVLSIDLGIRERLPNVMGLQWMQIALRLPSSWRGGLSLHSASGLLSVSGVQGTDFVLETVSGMVRMDHTRSMTSVVRTVSGSLLITDHTTRVFRTSNISGASSFHRLNAESVHITHVAGQTGLEMASVPATIEGTSVSGGVDLILPAASVDAALKSVTGKLVTEGLENREGAPCRIRMTTVTGGLRVVGSHT